MQRIFGKVQSIVEVPLTIEPFFKYTLVQMIEEHAGTKKGKGNIQVSSRTRSIRNNTNYCDQVEAVFVRNLITQENGEIIQSHLGTKEKRTKQREKERKRKVSS